MSKITRIRIPAEFRTDNTQTRTEVADFKLGLGPCEKEVVELDIRQSFICTGVCVRQECADGEVKQFHYPEALLTGRVEVEYGS